MDIKILECRNFTSTAPLTPIIRTVKDYEVDLELSKERTVVIDGVEHQIKRGDICVRHPGQTVYGRGKQISVLLTLDFSGKQHKSNYSRNLAGAIQPKISDRLICNLRGVITPYSEYTFISIYTELLSLTDKDNKAANELIMELIYKLNAEVCRRNYHKARPKENICGKLLNYIRNNLEKDITLDTLASIAHLDKNYLVRLFKRNYGQTPIKALISMRMERACDLITNTDMSISDIACSCGYASTSYFISEYKKHFGKTPLNQRKTQK